jgi:4'-phosphopantetheinyl transferase
MQLSVGRLLSQPPPLSGDDVHVYLVAIPGTGLAGLPWSDLLSAAERARAVRFHFDQHRERFVASRALLRLILARYVGADPARVEFCAGLLGKPELAEPFSQSAVRFNASRSGDVAVFAIARAREVGIDVEQCRAMPDLEQVVPGALTAHENALLLSLPPGARQAAFLHAWTQKEAYLKARGEGLARSPKEVEVAFVQQAAAGLRSDTSDPDAIALWTVTDLPAPEGYLAALAVEGHQWQLARFELRGAEFVPASDP